MTDGRRDARSYPRRPGDPRGTLRDVQRVLRRPTARYRVLPDFLIIGAQKAGTTSLYDYIRVSPDVRPAMIKEVHFFDRNYGRGENWYRSNFPYGSGERSWVTGESSPYYLLHPGIPRRVHEIVPDVRLIAILRHPVDRAYSHYHHSRSLGLEPASDFRTALDLEPSRTDKGWAALERGEDTNLAVEWYSYTRRSLYAPQLRRWLDIFGEEAVAVYTMEEMSLDPAQTVKDALHHIGVEPGGHLPSTFEVSNAREYHSIDPDLRHELFGRFADDVAEVEAILGRSTGWALS